MSAKLGDKGDFQPTKFMHLGLGIKTRWEEFSDARMGISTEFNGRVEFDRVCFGFFGEFGYALIAWVPYLKYISELFGCKMLTAGLPGSAPFYSFSSEHFEVDIQADDGWGSVASVRAAKLKLPRALALFAPTNEGKRSFQLNGVEWLTNELHRNIDCKHYSRLVLNERLSTDLFRDRKYVVINIKNHYNWGNTEIPNYYGQEDIAEIVAWARDSGKNVLVNRFPSPPENSNTYFNCDLEHLFADDFVVDLAPHYAALSTLAERNRMQIALLKGAERVFASQGGNAALALVTNKSVSILMRGGFDYPDYVSLARIYGADVEFVYAASQSKALRE